jgi:hypothetical protein
MNNNIINIFGIIIILIIIFSLILKEYNQENMTTQESTQETKQDDTIVYISSALISCSSLCSCILFVYFIYTMAQKK